MKAFLRGLLMGTIGSVAVLGLAVGVCYFSGLLDFAGREKEVFSSSVQSSGIAAIAGQVAQEDVQRSEETEPLPQETTEAEESLESERTKEEGIRLLFAGDLYLTELLQDKYRRTGIQAAVTEELLEFLKEGDLFILNQEFPFGTTGEAMEEKEYTFRVPPDLVSFPAELGVDLVTLANNHMLDFGRGPLTETLAALDGAGIAHVGAGEDLEAAKALKTFEIQGKTIGFLGASRVIPEASWNASKYNSGLFTTYDATQLVTEIGKAKESCDFVAVLVHWGIERNTFPEDYQKTLARQYIDAGADAVIGSHPHVLQGIEYYQGKPIFYSLGNFIFSNGPYESIVAEMELVGDEVKVRVIPCASEGNQMRLLNEKQDYYRRLQELSFGVRIGEDGTVLENE
ncbi:MAG: CapA family protein [Lachnospiraceae bacterium]|jgi:poly-gamma-glutamate synthesis protein (capsule biosynthesis protein)|uniref:CapA family protein n=1 Tax=Candidatus Merdisoma sp. JLR.KK006 TaxID=3112626 RepID=UPI002FF00DD2|nr:CapA family protein [Lachnospiraceae bacterium]